LGLGYGGFFTAWSGAKQYLSPKEVVCSALFVTVSLVLFVVFEIYSALIISFLSIKLSQTVNQPGADLSGALQTYRRRALGLTTPLLSIWKVLFPVTALTGLAGAGVLIYAFVGSLCRM
jgi:hypothetical protein